MRKTVEWDVVPLGRASDRDLARQLGVSKRAVETARTTRAIPAYPTKLKIIREIAYTALGRLTAKTLVDIHEIVESEYGSVDRRAVAQALATLVADGAAKVTLEDADEFNFKKKKPARKVARYTRGAREIQLYDYVSDEVDYE